MFEKDTINPLKVTLSSQNTNTDSSLNYVLLLCRILQSEKEIDKCDKVQRFTDELIEVIQTRDVDSIKKLLFEGKEKKLLQSNSRFLTCEVEKWVNTGVAIIEELNIYAKELSQELEKENEVGIEKSLHHCTNFFATSTDMKNLIDQAQSFLQKKRGRRQLITETQDVLNNTLKDKKYEQIKSEEDLDAILQYLKQAIIALEKEFTSLELSLDNTVNTSYKELKSRLQHYESQKSVVHSLQSVQDGSNLKQWSQFLSKNQKSIPKEIYLKSFIELQRQTDEEKRRIEKQKEEEELKQMLEQQAKEEEQRRIKQQEELKQKEKQRIQKQLQQEQEEKLKKEKQQAMEEQHQAQQHSSITEAQQATKPVSRNDSATKIPTVSPLPQIQIFEESEVNQESIPEQPSSRRQSLDLASNKSVIDQLGKTTKDLLRKLQTSENCEIDNLGKIVVKNEPQYESLITDLIQNAADVFSLDKIPQKNLFGPAKEVPTLELVKKVGKEAERIVKDFTSLPVYHSLPKQKGDYQITIFFVQFCLHYGIYCGLLRDIVLNKQALIKPFYLEGSVLRNPKVRDDLLLVLDLMQQLRFQFEFVNLATEAAKHSSGPLIVKDASSKVVMLSSSPVQPLEIPKPMSPVQDEPSPEISSYAPLKKAVKEIVEYFHNASSSNLREIGDETIHPQIGVLVKQKLIPSIIQFLQHYYPPVGQLKYIPDLVMYSISNISATQFNEEMRNWIEKCKEAFNLTNNKSIPKEERSIKFFIHLINTKQLVPLFTFLSLPQIKSLLQQLYSSNKNTLQLSEEETGKLCKYIGALSKVPILCTL